MGLFDKLGSAAEWTYQKGKSGVEILNLKTNHNFKDDEKLKELDDQKILSYQGSTRRAVASSVTGVVVNSALAVACPLFTVGAVINLWQMGVSARNRSRIKAEVYRRKQQDEKFAEKLKEKDHRVRDIALGCGINGVCIAATCGIVGFDSILDNFSQLAHEGTQHVVQSIATQHVGDAISNSNIQEVQHGLGSHHLATHTNGSEQAGDHPRADNFKARHPHLAKADDGFHKAVAGAGDWINHKLSHLTDLPFQDDWSWTTLKSWLHKPVEQLAAIFHIGVVGAANEAATPLLVVDPAVDRALESWENRERREQEKLAEAHITGLDNQSGHLRSGDRLTLRTQLVDIHSELRQRPPRTPPSDG